MNLSLSIDDWVNCLAETAEMTGGVVWVSQLDYQKILYVSDGFARHWGKSADTMYAHPTYFDSRLTTQKLPELYKECIERHNRPGSGSLIYQMVDESGDEKWMRDRYMTLCDAKGKPIAAAGISLDVTKDIDQLAIPKEERWLAEKQDDAKRKIAEQLKTKLSVLIDQNSPAKISLTNKEKECLRYLKQGYSARQTAELMYISSRTVEKHLDNLKFKFKCNNKVELLSKILEGQYELVNQ